MKFLTGRNPRYDFKVVQLFTGIIAFRWRVRVDILMRFAQNVAYAFVIPSQYYIVRIGN